MLSIFYLQSKIQRNIFSGICTFIEHNLQTNDPEIHVYNEYDMRCGLSTVSLNIPPQKFPTFVSTQIAGAMFQEVLSYRNVNQIRSHCQKCTYQITIVNNIKQFMYRLSKHCEPHYTVLDWTLFLRTQESVKQQEEYWDMRTSQPNDLTLCTLNIYTGSKASFAPSTAKIIED